MLLTGGGHHFRASGWGLNHFGGYPEQVLYLLARHCLLLKKRCRQLVQVPVMLFEDLSRILICTVHKPLHLQHERTDCQVLPDCRRQHRLSPAMAAWLAAKQLLQSRA